MLVSGENAYVSISLSTVDSAAQRFGELNGLIFFSVLCGTAGRRGHIMPFWLSRMRRDGARATRDVNASFVIKQKSWYAMKFRHLR